MPEPFANEPVLEMRRADVRARLEDALRRVDDELPLQVPVRIGEDARNGSPGQRHDRSWSDCRAERVDQR